MTRISNPDLTVGAGNKPRWNRPTTRRAGFHNAHYMFRRSLSLRAKSVLVLDSQPNPSLARHKAVIELTERPEFSGLLLVRDNRVLFQHSAPDFPSGQPHSIQSISKLLAHLMAGRLIMTGQLDPDRKVEDYLPEIGSGYRGARVSDVLDMNVANDFSEDYHDPHADSYAEEAALGWRLTEDHAEPRLLDFICAITSRDIKHAGPMIRYNSANTDLFALIAERLIPGGVAAMLDDIVQDAGFEHALHISLSREGVPGLCGGACLSLADLARLGNMLNRVAQGALEAWNAAYTRRTLLDANKSLPAPRQHVRYAGQMMSNGRWVGHTGYGGQVLMADPESGAVCAYFSVIENEAGYCVDYMARTMDLMADLLDLARMSS